MELRVDEQAAGEAAPRVRLPLAFGAAVVVAAVMASAIVSVVVARWTAPDARTASAPEAATDPTGPLASVLGAPPPVASEKEGAVTAGATRLLPSPNADLKLFTGQVVSAERVPIQQRVGERGMWIGTGDEDRIFVRFDEAGVDPPPPAAGQRLTLSGTFLSLPEGFEAKFGIGVPDGLDQLRSQGLYFHATAVRAS